MVAEGVKTSKVVMELAEEYGVDMPIASEVKGVCHDGHDRRRGLPRAAAARDRARTARHSRPVTGAVRRDGWLLPPGAARPPALLPLGTLAGGAGAVVDGRGLLTPGGEHGAWSLDWWVAAEDRWHLPAREPGTRQSLLDASPVVETRLRIPGGDAVHRCYAYLAPDGSERLTVEVANESGAPVAVAMAVRPFGPTGTGSLDHVALGDGEQVVRVDGHPVVVLPRRPAGAAWSTGDGADIVAAVTGGSAPRLDPAPDRPDPTGQATAAFVFPLPHRQSLRFVLAAPGTRPDRAAAVAVPSAEQVARGWAVQAGRGARVELPEPAMAQSVAVARRRLLLWGADAALAPSFDSLGLHDEVEEALAALVDPGTASGSSPPPAPYLLALATHARLTGRAELVAASEISIIAAADRLARSVRGRGRRPGPEPDATAGLDAAALLFEILDDRRAAADARRLTGARPAAPRPPGSDGGPADPWAGDPAAPAPSVQALRDRAVDTVGALRSLLVDDAGRDGIDVLPGWERRWYGQEFEAHDLPTAAGPLSFAVRWHGSRPALLWELAARPGSVGTPALSASALDPAWSSSERQGEALLAEVEPPPGAGAGPDRSGDGDVELPTSAQPPVSVWSIGPPSSPGGVEHRGQRRPEGGSFS